MQIIRYFQYLSQLYPSWFSQLHDREVPEKEGHPIQPDLDPM